MRHAKFNSATNVAKCDVRPVRSAAHAAAFEMLEDRRLFAGGIYEPLVINGTPNADNISVIQEGDFLKVTNNGTTTSHRWKSVIIPGSTPGKTVTLKGISKLVISGGDGNDTIAGAPSVTVKMEVYGGAGRDNVTGGSADDTLFGPEKRPTNGNTSHPSEDTGDVLTGGAGNDLLGAAARGVGASLHGGAGNDTVWGSEMSDVITGGTGNDNIQARAGNDDVTAGPEVVNFLVDDSDSVDAGEGNDVVKGGAAGDMLITGNGNDSVQGGAGNDTVSTGHGYDTVTGGLGNDKISLGAHNDRADGDAGNDTLEGGNDNDTLNGNAGDDLITGGAGRDVMDGGTGFDEVSYKDHYKPVFVSLKSLMNNGEAGEQDIVTSVFEAIRGGSGNDTLVGNDGANIIWGEGGDDQIRGGAGNDTLDGHTGDDRVWGEDGNDLVDGGITGDDELFGGKGNDTLTGGAGEDRLVAIGGGKDKLVGGISHDVYVADKSDDTSDYRRNTSEKDTLHKLDAFNNLVSIEPEGQNLSDPSLTGFQAHYGKRFNNIPLFHQGGPDDDDVIQGKIGDCYFMAGLAAIENSGKDRVLTHNIVDLGDGSYLVKFFNGSSPRWYRVDNQLPIKNGTNDQVMFAQLRGGDNAAMWVPIYEKAFALHRTGVGKYQEIVGDNDWTDPGMPYEAYGAFGLWHDTDEVIFNSTESLMKRMRAFLMAGGAVTASTDPPWLGCDITPFHVYTVEKVSADLKWVTIRNPWGTDDKAFASGPNDGRITISASQFDDDFFFVSYSNV